MTNSHKQQSNQPIRLQDAQSDIRDAYFNHEKGLFTLPCVAGAGKSLTGHRIAAENFLQRYVDGDPTPEQHIAIISFNRNEAAEIIPEVCDQLRTLVEHNLCPAALEVSDQEVEHLIDRIHQSPFIGTIDSLLRGVLNQFAQDIGFDEMPSVGNEALLARIHADCYANIKADSKYTAAVEALEAAYPEGEYDDNPAEMLKDALAYCRDRQLTTATFHRKLKRTRQAVYEEQPGEFDAIVAAVERVVGDADIGRAVREQVDTEDRDTLAEADETLYTEWGDRIDDFCRVLSAYREAYQEWTRERSVLSHTDVAFLVATYLEGTLDRYTDISINEDCRQRILGRYRARLRSMIIDEAQDVSEIQHAALSQLAHPEMRVLVLGDVFQSIYTWRHADPTLFESATTNGEYLSINWTTHVNEMATTTYRCVPDIAEAINEISAPMFNDEARGDIGTLDTQTAYARLDAARNPQAGTLVHISELTGVSNPGSEQWVLNPEGTGEGEKLAKHLLAGLADGTFTDSDGDPQPIRVLFRRETRMSEYREAFEAEGLRVRTANANLFDADEIEIVFAVCEWLISPESHNRTKQLLTESTLGWSALTEDFDGEEWDIDTVIEDGDLSEVQSGVLTGLQQLRDQRDICGMRPPSAYLENIIERLGLRSDTYCLCPDSPPQQRVANLDALIEMVSQWEADDHYNPKELTTLVAPFREDPDRGPVQPSAATSEYDVQFQKIHPAKGDEEDIVGIADTGFDATNVGVHNTRLVTHGEIAGLAPPTDVDVPTEIDIPAFDNGLYDPSKGFAGDIGLRWATARWRDSVIDTAPPDELIGPDHLKQVAEDERAELWRLLYVALTRARNHLVCSLPNRLRDDEYRDRWIETLKRGLGFEGGTDSYVLPTLSGDIEIGVNDLDITASSTTQRDSSSDAVVATTQPNREALDPWVPRFINPSTMYLLTTEPAEHALPHLLGDSIHTESNDAAKNLDLPYEAMGPDEIGSVIHDTLTRLIDAEIAESDLKSRGDIVSRVFNDVVYDVTPAIDDDERDRLWEFFNEILDDFLASELWEHIQQAESVRVEQPVDGLIKTNGVEIELHGKVDVVVVLPSGKRVVTDIKVALAQPTQATQSRYNLQVASYAYLFDQQDGIVRSVRPTIQTFGVMRRITTTSVLSELVESQIRNLTN
jgi:ATP-dependent helicase/nuclease subunit A